MRLLRIKKIWVDSDACLAHYLCVAEAPNIFEAYEDVWEVQLKSDIEGQLLEEAENILLAAAVCPVSAIKIELENGEIIDGDSQVVQAFIESKRKKH